jgi:hypothetical protein
MSYTTRQGLTDADFALKSYSNQQVMIKNEITEITTNRKNILSDIKNVINNIASAAIIDTNKTTLSLLEDEFKIPFLLSSLSEIENKIVSLVKRKKEVEAMDDFINKDSLINNSIGKYIIEMEKSSKFISEIEEQIEKFNTPEYKWLLNDKEKTKTRLTAFLDKITGTSKKRKENEDKLYQNLLIRNIDDAETKLLELNNLLDNEITSNNLIHGKIDKIKSIETEFNVIIEKIEKIKSTTPELLHGLLFNHLSRIDLSLIHPTVRDSFQISISGIIAMKHKVEYLEKIENFLKNELKDIEKRMDAIRNVSFKWRRSKKTYLKGDKSKWLREVPVLKHSSVIKKTLLCHKMSDSVCSFSDYSMFDKVILSGASIASFSIFASCYAEAMPSASFMQEVIPNLPVDSFSPNSFFENSDVSNENAVMSVITTDDNNSEINNEFSSDLS